MKNNGYTKLNGPELILDDAKRTPCEIWTRVMGYFRPYSQFNRGKKSEFNERKWFVEGAAKKQN